MAIMNGTTDFTTLPRIFGHPPGDEQVQAERRRQHPQALRGLQIMMMPKWIGLMFIFITIG